MPRGRFLPTSISLDADLSTVSAQAYMLYISAIPHLDRDGLIEGDATWLVSQTMPLRTNRISNPEELVAELEDIGMVVRYKGGRSGLVAFFIDFRIYNPNFYYHREEESHFATPPGWRRGQNGLIPVDLDRLRKYSWNLPKGKYKTELEACLEAAQNEGYFAESSNLDESGEFQTNLLEGQVEVEGQGQGQLADDADGQLDLSSFVNDLDLDLNSDRDPRMIARAYSGGHAESDNRKNAATQAQNMKQDSVNNDEHQIASNTDYFCGSSEHRLLMVKLAIVELVNMNFEQGEWNELDTYLSDLSNEERMSLLEWMWKKYNRLNWGESLGVGFFREMIARGERASLHPGERRGLREFLVRVQAAYGDGRYSEHLKNSAQ